MLTITRKDYQQVVIVLPDGRTIRVHVFPSKQADRTTLSFDAPPDILIQRDEVHQERVARGETPVRIGGRRADDDIAAAVQCIAARRAHYLALNGGAPEVERKRLDLQRLQADDRLQRLQAGRHLIVRGEDRRLYRVIAGRVEGHWGNVDAIVDMAGTVFAAGKEGAA